MKQLNIGHIGWLARDEGPDCKTVAWCDINEKKLENAKSKHPDITMYTDYREMVKHPGLDAVVISTPNFVHAEQSIAFLEAGKHVFLEKPMGINKQETDAILRAAQASGKHLVIDFEMRMSPFADRVKELIDSGDYGELRHIEFIHHRGSWLEQGNGIWRTRPDKSGGMYFMEPIHEVDIFRFFGGEIAAAQSTAAPAVLPQYRFEDNVCSHFFFESGALGTILTSHTYSAFAKDPASWEALGHDMQMIFTLTGGAIGVDFWKARLIINEFEEFPKGTGAIRVVPGREETHCAGNMHAFAHDITAMRKEFIRRAAAGEAPVQDALDAWKTHQVCLAAEQSLQEDCRRIDVDYTKPA
jgi:predicted dehydrogenase